MQCCHFTDNSLNLNENLAPSILVTISFENSVANLFIHDSDDFLPISAPRVGRKQPPHRHRSVVETDAVQTNHGILQCVGKHGDVAALDGSGEQTHYNCRFTHGIRPFIHLQLHIDV